MVRIRETQTDQPQLLLNATGEHQPGRQGLQQGRQQLLNLKEAAVRKLQKPQGNPHALKELPPDKVQKKTVKAIPNLKRPKRTKNQITQIIPEEDKRVFT